MCVRKKGRQKERERKKYRFFGRKESERDVKKLQDIRQKLLDGKNSKQ